ncbi:MAG: 7-carboxy-7-deazaguanine synthase QueE [Gammaproteobacteria bacterium]|nr:7-carboxy-7-deazaguanine synthase QueE [Gammaproteobacteria bacterium]
MSANTLNETGEATPVSRLRITEIFYSLQGEARTSGYATVFIRLTGCPLRCEYCDTSYAFKGGEWFTFDEILSEVKKYKTKHVTVTGGEPLAQKQCPGLLKLLCDEGYDVSLETSGALDISLVDQRVSRVMDLKTPASKEVDKNRYENIALLTPHDQLKFVICNREDYDWAVQKISEYDLLSKCEVFFSTSHQELKAQTLAGWIIEDQLAVRFQLQLHKYLWDDEPGR